MKAKIAVLALATAALFVSACEKHQWSETKQLFQEHEQEAKAPEAGKTPETAKTPEAK